MTTAATLIDWDALSQRLSPIEVSTAEKVIKRKSRDYYWFSPVLKAQLEEVRADAIVTPASAGEVSQVVRFCVENRLPLTLRGGGTGNYGQAMPLKGGVVMDMTRLTAICHIGDGVVRAEAGAKMYDIEQAVNAAGYELRFFPSTWKSATIGGFVAGGSTGCGAIGFGTLHSGDNVRAAKVLTAEESPRILELTGRDAQAVVHAYGTNGVILEVELALAPRRAWHDRIVAFDDLPTTLAFAAALGADGAIPKRQLTIYGATTASLIRPVADLDTGACPLVLTMIAEEALPAFDALLAAHGGRTVFTRAPGERIPAVPPIFELGWNHTTLHALSRDPAISYIQADFGPDWQRHVIAAAAELGEEAPLHLEMALIDGALCCFGISLLRFTSAERLEEIHQILRRHGCTIFNPHTYILENGGMQVADPQQLAFRKEADPLGLCNPGKMPGWDV